MDDVTGEWNCPVCDTKCDSQHSFTVHIRQHNPTDHSHTCSICGKTLSSASSLDRHMLIHSGERPFKCKICNMTFTTNGNMHRHMRTHGMESNENDAPDSNNNKHSNNLNTSNTNNNNNNKSHTSPHHLNLKGSYSSNANKNNNNNGNNNDGDNDHDNNNSTIINNNNNHHHHHHKMQGRKRGGGGGKGTGGVVAALTTNDETHPENLSSMTSSNNRAISSSLSSSSSATTATSSVSTKTTSSSSNSKTKVNSEDDVLPLQQLSSTPVSSSTSSPTATRGSHKSSTTLAGSKVNCIASNKLNSNTDGNTNTDTDTSTRNNIGKNQKLSLCDRSHTSSSSSSSFTSPLSSGSFTSDSQSSNKLHLSTATAAAPTSEKMRKQKSPSQSTNHSKIESITCNLCGLILPSLSNHHCTSTTRNNCKSGIKRNNNNNKYSNNNGNNNINDNNNNGIAANYASIGFHDLTFTDFSSHKYPLIAQSFCEANIRKSSSPYHDFQCTNCPKAFPCAAALSLHQSTVHHQSHLDPLSSASFAVSTVDTTSLGLGPTNNSIPSSTYCHLCQVDLGSPVLYLTHQAIHQYETIFHAVSGVNLTTTTTATSSSSTSSSPPSSTSSPSNFPKAIVTNPTVNTTTGYAKPSTDNVDDDGSGGVNNGKEEEEDANDLDDDRHNTVDDHVDYDHGDRSANSDNEKEQFLGMLELYKKNKIILNNNISINNINNLVKVHPAIEGSLSTATLPSSPLMVKDEKSSFDHPSYFINAKATLNHQQMQQQHFNNNIPTSNTTNTAPNPSKQNSLLTKSKVNHSKSSSDKLNGHSNTEKTKESKKHVKHNLTDNNLTNIKAKDSLLNMTSPLPSPTSSSATIPVSHDESEISRNKKRKLSSLSPSSVARLPSRGMKTTITSATDSLSQGGDDKAINARDDDHNPPSAASSCSEDGEKEMEIDMSENNSSGTTGSMEKENAEENNDGGETGKQSNGGNSNSNNSNANTNNSNSSKVTRQPYHCDICVLDFKSFTALKRHNRGHTKSGHNYACNLCPYTSLDKSTLVRHLRTHNGERPFQCAICKYAFTTKANCERHVRKRHKKLSKQEIKSAMLFNAGLTTSSSTSASSHLTIQNISHHNALPNIFGPEWPGPTDTLCRYCNHDLKSNKILRHHIKTIHSALSSKPYSCTQCKMGFSTKNNCIRHVMRIHPEIKEDLSSVVLVNGTSVQSQSGSDDVSESDLGVYVEASSVGGSSAIGSDSRYISAPINSTSHHNNNNHDIINSRGVDPSLSLADVTSPENAVEAITLALQFHSSLAALCQIAGAVSPIGGNPASTGETVSGLPGLHGNAQSPSTLEGDWTESTGDVLQLIKKSDSMKRKLLSNAGATPRIASIHPGLFLARTESQPLDLAVHALDLSCKNAPFKPSLENPSSSATLHQSLLDLHACSEPIRTAASSLLALQSFVPNSNNINNTNNNNETLLSLPNSNPLQANSIGSPLPGGLRSSSSPTANATANPVNHISKGLSSSATSLYTFDGTNLNTNTNNISKSSILSKHSRTFTCRYCSSGFTLKSNMERHIKRKHPLYARPKSSKGATSTSKTSSSSPQSSPPPTTSTASPLS